METNVDTNPVKTVLAVVMGPRTIGDDKEFWRKSLQY
jgi:hypothetical protein